jgi:hypothetical protein
VLTRAQEIDGLREAELAGKQIGTTKRGIGPAYASKATRNGIRVGELRDLDAFAAKLRVLALDGQKRFQGFEYDVEVRTLLPLLGFEHIRSEETKPSWEPPKCDLLHVRSLIRFRRTGQVRARILCHGGPRLSNLQDG